MTDSKSTYTPPLRYNWLTPIYDTVIRALTRETAWRSALIQQIDPSPDDRILDVGCGTGTLAVELNKLVPEAEIIGIDPDTAALVRALAKVDPRTQSLRFLEGFLSESSLPLNWKPNKIVSSLVFHQTPETMKRELLFTMRDLLAENGEIHIADYGFQKGPVMRALFRMTVQMLDGVADTQPNADGILPELMREVELTVDAGRTLPTPTGSISLYRAMPRGMQQP